VQAAGCGIQPAALLSRRRLMRIVRYGSRPRCLYGFKLVIPPRKAQSLRSLKLCGNPGLRAAQGGAAILSLYLFIDSIARSVLVSYL
jgi:hypothetical protein